MMNSLAGYPFRWAKLCLGDAFVYAETSVLYVCCTHLQVRFTIQNVYLHFSRTYLKDLGAESDQENRNFTEICSAQEWLFWPDSWRNLEVVHLSNSAAEESIIKL